MFNKDLLNILEYSHLEIYNHWKEKYPSIFYLGLGKCASQSICKGFYYNKVAHWHSERHFYKTYNLDISPLTLLDIAKFVSEYHPILIIECVREPVSRALSIFFQELYTNRLDASLSSNIKFIQKWIIEYLNTKLTLYANNWKSYYGISILDEFDINKEYFYIDKKDINTKFLLLKYETINNFNTIIQSIGYDFKMKCVNKTSDRPSFKRQYSFIKQAVKFSKEDLHRWYNNPIINSFYTTQEISKYIELYSYE